MNASFSSVLSSAAVTVATAPAAASASSASNSVSSDKSSIQIVRNVASSLPLEVVGKKVNDCLKTDNLHFEASPKLGDEPVVKNKLPTIDADASIPHNQQTKDEFVSQSNSKEVQTTKAVLKPVPVVADSVNNPHNKQAAEEFVANVRSNLLSTAKAANKPSQATTSENTSFKVPTPPDVLAAGRQNWSLVGSEIVFW